MLPFSCTLTVYLLLWQMPPIPLVSIAYKAILNAQYGNQLSVFCCRYHESAQASLTAPALSARQQQVLKNATGVLGK